MDRRMFLKSTIAGAAAAALGDPRVVRADDAPGKGVGARPDVVSLVRRVHPRNVVDGYGARGLARATDAELYGGVAGIVSEPASRLGGFSLHAPLELMARFGLLSLVVPADRELARIQMVATGAAYNHHVRPVAAPAKHAAFPDLDTAARELEGVLCERDTGGTEAVVMQMASQFGLASLVETVTPRLLPTLTAVSHSHIGLWLLMRHGGGGMGDAALLRAATRLLATNPGSRLRSFDGMNIGGGKPLDRTPAKIAAELMSKLADPPRGRQVGSIIAAISGGERTGTIDRLFGDLIRHDLTREQIDAAFRALLRVSAHVMLQDDQRRAKFFWSHCLTLPQAACGLSTLNMNRKLGLAATLVWVTSFRTMTSRKALDMTYQPPRPAGKIGLAEALASSPEVAAGRFWHAKPSEIDAMRVILASEASVRNDQHLVKYTRACLDLCVFDPMGWRLYLASAAKLCAIWIAETPRDRIKERLHHGRPRRR